ncbi:complement C3-like [Hypomesus transpacificus]|uniref:complement C3-like n=1 Tax=Hypomesus transpacificus TaxID=137520 RepID=UPI001F0749FF|nr:complement C3-like [Hypomesus transpacificus]
MRVELVCVVLATLAVSFPSPSAGAPLQVLSAPNVLRVGTKEKVFVEIQDHSGGPFVVTVIVMNHPTKTKQLFEKAVQLNSDNKFQSLVEVFIPEEDYINMDDRQKQYVYLQARFPSGTLEKVVLASFQAGYIFIQTDKPIYNPGTKVLYRALAVTPTMEPLTKDQFEQDKYISIDIDVVTPENITILRETVTPDKGMKSGDFKLPDIVSPGVWQLVSRFQATPQRTFTTEFEVKEYVLPSFEVKVEPRKYFFYIDDESLHVDLTVRYLLGKEVYGVAYVMFGVVKGGNKHSFPSSLQRVEIQKGKGEAVLNRDDITRTFKVKELVSQSIYVSVKVLTESGGEMVEAEKGGIQIVESPYTIHFKHTPKFFKPGMPFNVKVYVTNPDQTPAKRVQLVVSPNGGSTFTSDQGIAVATVNTGISESMKIIVKTNDPDIKLQDRQATATLDIYPYKSKTRNLLHLLVSTKDENMQVDMAFGEGPSDMDITILILSRGQLVESIRKQRKWKQTILSSTFAVTKYMLPSFRIVAYYHVGTTEVVSDSVCVEVQTSCMGTLKVEAIRPATSYRPRDIFELKITGDPGAKVGLVVVDKGVTVLNNKHRLTQKKIWDVVEKYDTGCTAGSGQNSMGVFYDAGLMFETNTASGTNIRTEPNCPVRTRRRRSDGDDDDASYLGPDDILSRTHFPESWLWTEYTLPSCPLGQKCETTSTNQVTAMPDSITTWQITAISLSKENAICVTEPFEILVLKDFFIDLRLPNSAVYNEQLEVKAVLHNYKLDPIKVRVYLMENANICSSANKRKKYVKDVTVEAESTLVVPYVMIPMKLGEQNIEVKASVFESVLEDGVVKVLRVVPPGELVRKLVTVEMDPSKSGGVEKKVLKSAVPQNQVPNTPASTEINVIGRDQTGVLVEEFDLEVNIQVSGMRRPDRWYFNRRNRFVTRTTKLRPVPDINLDVTVEARGVGTATISVLTLYYAVLDQKNSSCNDFDLEVEMVKEGKASYPGAEATYLLKIKTKYKSQERDATMSVLDIGLLTGFIVDIGDLTKLMEGKDRYIEKFEMDKALSERGSLIIYLNQVSHTEWGHVTFRIHSVDKVGVLQPAAVTVYEYYQKSRCRVFYHPQRTDGGLLRLCSGEDQSICKCAEGQEGREGSRHPFRVPSGRRALDASRQSERSTDDKDLKPEARPLTASGQTQE